MNAIKIFAVAMVSMFSVNVNASEAEAPVVDKNLTMVYNYNNTKNEYEIKNGEVISKTVYKWIANEEAWKPCMKYAVSKNADSTVLSCGYWNENMKDFSSNLSCQSFSSADYPSVIMLPRPKDMK